MKYALAALILPLLHSCDPTPPVMNRAKADPQKDSMNSLQDGRLEKAMRLSDQIFYFVEQADMKKITKREMKRNADPLQKSLDSIIKLLDPQRHESIKEYRGKIVEGMVDRKVLRDKNNKP